MNAVAWLGSWILIIVGLMVAARTDTGNKLIRYVLWLMVVLILVTNYKAIVALMNAGSSATSTSSATGGATPL